MSQLLNSRFLSDGVTSVQIVTSIFQPAGAKGVIYHDPPDLTDEDLLESLIPQKVTYIKRFKKDSSWSTTVFLVLFSPVTHRSQSGISVVQSKILHSKTIALF